MSNWRPAGRIRAHRLLHAARSDRNEPFVIKNDIKLKVVSTINQVLVEVCRNFLIFTNKFD
jgi:hypothetical protein